MSDKLDSFVNEFSVQMIILMVLNRIGAVQNVITESKDDNRMLMFVLKEKLRIRRQVFSRLRVNFIKAQFTGIEDDGYFIQAYLEEPDSEIYLPENYEKPHFQLLKSDMVFRYILGKELNSEPAYVQSVARDLCDSINT